MEYLLYLGALALIAVGLAGTVIPAIPGLPIIFAGSWLIGWASGYELISVTAVVILALLAAVGIGIDILAQILGAKRAGASRAGLWGAVIGTVVGLVTGIWGIVFFPLIGAVIGEIMAGRDMLKAGTVGLATWIGMAVGIGVKIALAFIMVGIVLFSIVTNSGITSFFGGSSAAASSAAVVPQAPNGAAPLEGHPGQPSERGRIVEVPQGQRSKSSDDASSPAVDAAPSDAAPAAPAPAAPAPAAPAPAAPAPSNDFPQVTASQMKNPDAASTPKPAPAPAAPATQPAAPQP